MANILTTYNAVRNAATRDHVSQALEGVAGVVPAEYVTRLADSIIGNPALGLALPINPARQALELVKQFG